MTPHALAARIAGTDFAPRFGRVCSVSPGLVEANGPAGTLGELCAIETGDGTRALAEIVAIDDERVLFSPLDTLRAIPLDARVYALAAGASVSVGDEYAGRALNALGEPIDGGDQVRSTHRAPLHGNIPRPLDRVAPDAVLQTGIKAIDGLLTLGRGQRVGILAASGVGKTSLVEQLAVQMKADRVILCLVGERGREVESLWRTIRGREDASRFTVVAATSDESASHRARAPSFALALAEYWRDRGEHVLFLVDSVTRLAMALREIGLAAGSPPTVRAYTPNVFAVLPRLVERCGAVRDGGAISAIITVLSETDEVDDPIVELMKSLLDGHLILSRTLAEQGHFPAIDVTRSVSRGVERRVEPAHRTSIREAIAMLSAYDEARVMIETGAYRSGTNPLVDRAIARREALNGYLRQPSDADVPFESTLAGLTQALGGRSDAH